MIRFFTFVSIFMSVVYAQDLITPIPKEIKHDKQKAKIGKILFFDTRLSKDKKISCASCHKPSNGWSDNKKVSTGVFGQKDIIQTPTILNAVFNFREFWNGRAKNLKEQVDITLHNSIEMGMDKKSIEKRVNGIKSYKDMFKEDYISYKMIVEAIAEFQKTLITPEAKFDRYIEGKIKLSKDELNGYETFKRLGCITCHNGKNVGGNSFQKIGIIFKYDNCPNDRYSITKNSIDKCVYKVPTLRNIALTPPYFHDGSSKTLKSAIEKMAYYNLGYIIDEKETKNIEKFLKTLTGNSPKLSE